jgi:hypothetical protein
MTANRRPGFRLPWSSELDADADGGDRPAAEGAVSEIDQKSQATAEEPAMTAATPDQAAAEPSAAPTSAPEATTAATTSPPAAAPHAAEAQPGSPDFMRDLVEAMRRVAEEARDTTLADIRTRAEEQVRHLQEEAERRRADLHERAEADIAAVDEWLAAETQRIRAEAERRAAARRTQLEEQLAGEAGRSDEAARLVRERVAAYERELEAYHARLAEIGDPAVFADAAKRVPSPPSLELSLASVPAAQPPAVPATPLGQPSEARAVPAAAPEAPAFAAPETADAEMESAPAAVASVHPTEEALLNIQGNGVHAEPDAVATTATEAARPQPVTTDVVVKGLGSFGAITGFRQTLAGIDGIEGVALSLGQTGEFVFRATHLPGFDVAEAIRSLEGENAAVEAKPDGALAVTLDRTR